MMNIILIMSMMLMRWEPIQPAATGLDLVATTGAV